jgi:hypothetical protein
MNNLNQLANSTVMILMVSAVNRSLGVPGASLSCSISKAGGAFSAISPTVVDRGKGWYAIQLTAADTSVAGELVLHVEASGCDHSDLVFDVVSRNRSAKLLA